MKMIFIDSLFNPYLLLKPARIIALSFTINNIFVLFHTTISDKEIHIILWEFYFKLNCYQGRLFHRDMCLTNLFDELYMKMTTLNISN